MKGVKPGLNLHGPHFFVCEEDSPIENIQKSSPPCTQVQSIPMSVESSAGLTRLMKAEADAQKIIEDARNSTQNKFEMCFWPFLSFVLFSILDWGL